MYYSSGKAISKLCEGMKADEIAAKLAGNTCGFKSTSCADQLAIAVREAYEELKRMLEDLILLGLIEINDRKQ